jgi:hypothetical protein
MGQLQPKESEGKRDNAVGDLNVSPSNLKDRVGAKFEQQNAVNPAYAKGGSGKQGNPGKPV